MTSYAGQIEEAQYDPFGPEDYRADKPMAGAMAIVFVSFGFVMFLASQTAMVGSSTFAVGLVALIVVLFTLVDIEFGVYCIVAGMLLSPEIPVDFIQLPGRKVVIRIEDVMIIVVGAAWFAKLAAKGKFRMLHKTPLNKPIIIFSFLTVLSTVRGVFTHSVGHTMTAVLYIVKFFEFFLLFFLVVNNIQSQNQVKRIMSVYFVTLLIVVAWATWTTLITGEIGRATTPFESEGEPGTLGGYLLFSFALAFGIMNYQSNFVKKALYFGIMILIIPPFLYTLSRGSYLAFFPMFGSVLLLSKKKGAPILLLLIFAMMVPYLPSVTIERVEYTFQNRVEKTFDEVSLKERVDPSSAARLERYEGVLGQWAHRPLLGQGVTGVGFVDGQLVRVLGEVGILGVLALFWLFRNMFRTMLIFYKRVPDGYFKGLTLGVLAGSIGLLFHGATANTFTVVRIAGPFWIVIGLIFALNRLIETNDENIKVETAAA